MILLQNGPLPRAWARLAPIFSRQTSLLFHVKPQCRNQHIRSSSVYFPHCGLLAISRSKRTQSIVACLSTHTIHHGVTPRDTIFALSSGGVRAGVAVIRVSGPEAERTIKAFTRKLPPPARFAAVRKLYDPNTAQLLDEALVLRFEQGHSFTGEEIVEFHVHGGNAVVSSILRSLETIDGLRHAEPGEFTRRSFWNDRMDLTQVEGLADLITAETEHQQKQALLHMTGQAGRAYTSWMQTLRRAVAHIEAYIDFSEDENIEDGVLHQVSQIVSELISQIKVHLETARIGERLRNGLIVTITGQPNVGKSTLLNILCQRDVAIVASVAGTTRDIVEISADIAGYPVVIQDTAGIRYGSTVGEIEEEGIRRAEAAAQRADLRICVQDAAIGVQTWCNRVGGLRDCSCSALSGKTLLVLNKVDIACDARAARQLVGNSEPVIFPVSCITKEGLDAFQHYLADTVRSICMEGTGTSGDHIISRERHRRHISSCLECLQDSQVHADIDVVLQAQYLRYALHELGLIVGVVHLEDILDDIFNQFCIGK